ncbi:hypothetical protein F4604DRAFT_1794058 [Suillus subluteus]|nr:hypothetical protein F4604DRAFT_1794058 [Suillus subluteus]
MFLCSEPELQKCSPVQMTFPHYLYPLSHSLIVALDLSLVSPRNTDYSFSALHSLSALLTCFVLVVAMSFLQSKEEKHERIQISMSMSIIQLTGFILPLSTIQPNVMSYLSLSACVC